MTALLEREQARAVDSPFEPDPIEIAALASGGGTTVESLLLDYVEGVTPVKIGLVVYNNANAGVVDKVTAINEVFGLGVELHHISGKLYPSGAGVRGETNPRRG
jgi:hypothetical protein